MIIMYGTSAAVNIGVPFSMPAVDVYIRFLDLVVPGNFVRNHVGLS